MEIRRAKHQDVDRLNELLYQVAQIHAEGRPDIFKAAAKKYSDEELRSILQCDTTPVFVAVMEGRVVGYAFCVQQKTENNLLLQERRTLYIDDLCVDECVRGRHIGTQLYEFVVDYAKKNGFDAVTLNVWAFHTAARAFYEKCGMKPQRMIMEKNLKE